MKIKLNFIIILFIILNFNYYFTISQEINKGEEFFKKGIKFYKQNKLNKARIYFEKALKFLNSEDSKYLYTLNNLGCVYLKLRKYKKALSYLEKAYSEKNTYIPTDKKSIGKTLKNIALIYKKLKKYKKAKKYFQLAKKYLSKTKRITRPKIELILSNDKREERISIGSQRNILIQKWQFLKIIFKTKGYYIAYYRDFNSFKRKKVLDIKIDNFKKNSVLKLPLKTIKSDGTFIWFYSQEPFTKKQILNLYEKLFNIQKFLSKESSLYIALKGLVNNYASNIPLYKMMDIKLHFYLIDISSYLEYHIGTLDLLFRPIKVELFQDNKPIIRNQSLKSGSRFYIKITNYSDKDYYLYIFHKDSRGNVYRLYPLKNNFSILEANTSFILPDMEGYQLDNNKGWEYEIFFYSLNKMDIEKLEESVRNTNFKNLIGNSNINTIKDFFITKGYDGFVSYKEYKEELIKKNEIINLKQAIIIRFKHE